MGALLRGMAVWCAALFALGAGCGEADDLGGSQPDAGAGTSGAGATGGTAGDAGGSAGGTSASGGVSAAGGSNGSGGSGGAMGTSAEDGSAGAGGSGAETTDAASDSGSFDGKEGGGGSSDGSTDANFCLCPTAAPASGSECRPCTRPAGCTYNGCLGSGNAVITATCGESSRTWVIKSDPCNSFQCGAPPGGRRCNANQICVLPYATCVDNPCGDQAFSCGCAQSACPGAGYRCLEQGDRTIYCNCLTC
jgi:hypothetical protein